MAVSIENSKKNNIGLDIDQIENISGEAISACYQCEKCTNGCPDDSL